MRKYFDICVLASAMVIAAGARASAQYYRAEPDRYMAQRAYYPAQAQAPAYRALAPQYAQAPVPVPVAPSINSVYSAPMGRTSEIPLYGRNKSMYFYGQPKQDDGVLAGSGLYAFAAFSTGKTSEGVNMERQKHLDDLYLGSNANNTMGTATGSTIGVGKNLSSSLSVELGYSMFSGLEYGDSERYFGEEFSYTDEDSGEDVYDTVVVEGMDIADGGGIRSNFLNVGFVYKLGDRFGSILNGMLKPYVGVQVGYAVNTLEDYTFADPVGYMDPGSDWMYIWDETAGDEGTGGDVPNIDLVNNGYCMTASDICTQLDYTDGSVSYMGKTNRTFGYGLELGLTLEMDSNLEIDFFFKRSMLGRVSNSGSMLSKYYETPTYFYYNQTGTCASGYYLTTDQNWCALEDEALPIDSMRTKIVESGNLTINQYGVKLKYLF